jgi:DNA-binding MarR family transcriptional regulator/predicted GNAT family N-acyltransferase
VDADVVTRVRRFNRTVTQRVGALDDRYLSRDRPLGEARVLWEVGDGCEVRTLRTRLDLDSGYLSRLLRSLEADGLLEVVPSGHDGRVRAARLTAAGRRERHTYDERSDALAASLVAPLNERQRARLVAAMDEVERLLTAGLVEVEEVDPLGSVAQACLQEYFAELDERFATGFDPDAALPTDASVFLVARLRGEPIGCGALKPAGRSTTEIKRMWVAPSTRGLGVGRRLLAELERRAAEHGARSIRLDSNGSLVEAIAMYRAAGYVEVEPFNDEPHATVWMHKPL